MIIWFPTVLSWVACTLICACSSLMFNIHGCSIVLLYKHCRLWDCLGCCSVGTFRSCATLVLFLKPHSVHCDCIQVVKEFPLSLLLWFICREWELRLKFSHERFRTTLCACCCSERLVYALLAFFWIECGQIETLRFHIQGSTCFCDVNFVFLMLSGMLCSPYLPRPLESSGGQALAPS